MNDIAKEIVDQIEDGKMENAKDFFISRQKGDLNKILFFDNGICGRFFLFLPSKAI